MKLLIKPLLIATALLATGPVQAQPKWVNDASMDRIYAQSSQDIQLAHGYRRFDRYPSRRSSRRSNNWAAPLVAGALIGAIIAHSSSQARTGGNNAYLSAKRRCAQKYRSYDWDSDSFVTYGGVVKLCPYVRSYYP